MNCNLDYLLVDVNPIFKRDRSNSSIPRREFQIAQGLTGEKSSDYILHGLTNTVRFQLVRLPLKIGGSCSSVC